jgi:hypothetical protein
MILRAAPTVTVNKEFTERYLLPFRAFSPLGTYGLKIHSRYVPSR